MQESGTVTQLCGPNAKVLIERRDACGHCNACGLMSGNQKNIVVEVKNTLGALPGDLVEIVFSGKVSLRSTAIAYLIPLAMLIIGVVLGYTVIAGLIHTEQEPTAAICGILFAAASFGILKLFDRAMKNKLYFEMRSILREGEKA